MKNSITTVTIDFWNTLFDSSGGLERKNYRHSVLKKAVESCGYTGSDEQLQKAQENCWIYFENIWRNEHRTPLLSNVIDNLWTELGVLPDSTQIKEVERAFAESTLVHKPKLINGADAAIEKLKLHYKIALISDTGFSHGEILKQLMRESDVLRHFDSFSFSDETGVSKPHEKAYHTVLNHLSTSPVNALHIGDIEQTDIAGAKNIGMKAIRFRGDKTEFKTFDIDEATKADYEANTWEEILDILM